MIAFHGLPDRPLGRQIESIIYEIHKYPLAPNVFSFLESAVLAFDRNMRPLQIRRLQSENRGRNRNVDFWILGGPLVIISGVDNNGMIDNAEREAMLQRTWNFIFAEFDWPTLRIHPEP